MSHTRCSITCHLAVHIYEGWKVRKTGLAYCLKCPTTTASWCGSCAAHCRCSNFLKTLCDKEKYYAKALLVVALSILSAFSPMLHWGKKCDWYQILCILQQASCHYSSKTGDRLSIDLCLTLEAFQAILFHYKAKRIAIFTLRAVTPHHVPFKIAMAGRPWFIQLSKTFTTRSVKCSLYIAWNSWHGFHCIFETLNCTVFQHFELPK